MNTIDRIAASGAVAQWLEQGTHNALVDGSIPSCLTNLRLSRLA
jgi:hypothetical protein